MSERTCSVEGCERGGKITRGMCVMHYRRWLYRETTDVRSKPVCSVDGCDRSGPMSRGMCEKHYARWRRLGTTDIHTPTVAERLAAKLIRMPSGCLEWTGPTNYSPKNNLGGYGVIGLNYRQTYTHRLAWTLANGPIPDGLHVLHRCDNRLCCEPTHLFIGTRTENMADMVIKGRWGGPRRRNNTKEQHDRQ